MTSSSWLPAPREEYLIVKFRAMSLKEDIYTVQERTDLAVKDLQENILSNSAIDRKVFNSYVYPDIQRDWESFLWLQVRLPGDSEWTCRPLERFGETTWSDFGVHRENMCNCNVTLTLVMPQSDLDRDRQMRLLWKESNSVELRHIPEGTEIASTV